MSERPHEREGHGTPAYDSFRTETGAVVVYDRANEDAWIQSTVTVGLGSDSA